MEITKKTFTVCMVVFGCIAAAYFIYLSKSILLYIVVALVLAIAINPAVKRLQQLRFGRVWAIVLSMVLLIGIILGVLGLIIVPLVRQGIGFAQNLPAISEKFITNPKIIALDQRYHIAGYLNEASAHTSELLLGGSTSVFAIATNAIAVVSSVSIILVLTFLLLLEGIDIWRRALGLLSEKNREVAERVGKRIAKAIAGFVSGNLLISLIAGIVTFITLWILGVPYKFALSALVALFDIIPLVGAAIATIVVGIVALTKGVIVAIAAVGVLLIYQFIEGHIIQPVVYSRSINLSALFIVLASLVGAEIAGIVGVLLAIPIAAVIQILVTELYGFFSQVKL